MATPNPDKIILASAIVTITSTTAAELLPPRYVQGNNGVKHNVGGKGELPSPRLLIGSGITFAGLSMLGDFLPNVAGPLAMAIGLTALTYYGFPLLNYWLNPS